MEGVFEKLVLSNACPPLVIQGAISDWPAGEWTPAHLAEILGDKLVKCKIAPIDTEEMLWEPDCLHLSVTLAQYTDWIDRKAKGDNPLAALDPSSFSCYVDYKYMKDLFEDHPEQLKAVNWSGFGLVDRDGKDSTIWIGSTGAYTNCHYDTYGFNLVAQIYGRKRWILFPPEQSSCLYPTRIPYEESSVFSEVNPQCPDLRKHDKFLDTTPHIIDLEPGMVLYVPRHWWHFVYCEQSAISINTWVPMDVDKTTHVEEAITRLLFSSVSQLLAESPSTSLPYLNTNEELTPGTVSLDLLRCALRVVTTNKNTSTDTSDFEIRTQDIPQHSKARKSVVLKDTNETTASSSIIGTSCPQENDITKAKEYGTSCHGNHLTLTKTATNVIAAKSSIIDMYGKEFFLIKLAEAFQGICVKMCTFSLGSANNSSKVVRKRKHDNEISDDEKVLILGHSKVLKQKSESSIMSGCHGDTSLLSASDTKNTSHSNTTDCTHQFKHIGDDCNKREVVKPEKLLQRDPDETIQVYSVGSVPCQTYLHFLTHEYNYTCIDTNTSPAVTPRDADTVDVLSSILHPHVVQNISKVLCQRLQK